MKYNLGIDLDGVVCDLYDDALKIAKELYGAKINKDIMPNSMEDAFGLSSEQVEKIFCTMGSRGMYRNAKIYPGCKEILHKLNKKYNIYFVSWRNYIPNSREDTLYWLDSNKIPYEKLIMTSNKHKVAEKEGFVFFLDDSPQQCNRIAKTIIPTYLFERPWNKNEELDSMVKIIKNWKEVEKILNF